MFSLQRNVKCKWKYTTCSLKCSCQVTLLNAHANNAHRQLSSKRSFICFSSTLFKCLRHKNAVETKMRTKKRDFHEKYRDLIVAKKRKVYKIKICRKIRDKNIWINWFFCGAAIHTTLNSKHTAHGHQMNAHLLFHFLFYKSHDK